MDISALQEELPLLSSDDFENFKKDLLATVYNHTNTQLLIYQRGKCLKNSKNTKTKKSKKAPTALLNDEPMPSEEILDDIKLDKELDALRHIYELAYNELTKKLTSIDADNDNDNLPSQTTGGQDGELIHAIESRQQNNNEVDLITKELRENKAILKELKEQMKTEKANFEQKYVNRTERLEHLRDQLHNIKRINDLECRLVEKWEANRLSQATIMGQNEERSLMKQIVDLHRRLAGEQRLICEVEAFRKHEAQQLQEQIDHWNRKFTDEKAKIFAKNLQLSETIADLIKSHEKHSEIKAERRQFVNEYLKEKEEERRLYEEQMYRVECAVRIQSWWRGTMVRNGLGPYRKKSKKGKKSKAKK
ncbi:dynein regulatory complex protein 9 [Musca domestica]|uniref:Dynein regulatory complex protein 9 n=1 Tax=Musca domestica TaxID=7370 RepID=A0A1I8MN08_MUSDO|nr:dynein regulatory complex protein 9 [Musca domestica]